MGKLGTPKNLSARQNQSLHGPQTVTYGETSYSKKIYVLDRTKVLQVLELKPIGKLATPRKSKY